QLTASRTTEADPEDSRQLLAGDESPLLAYGLGGGFFSLPDQVLIYRFLRIRRRSHSAGALGPVADTPPCPHRPTVEHVVRLGHDPAVPPHMDRLPTHIESFRDLRGVH